MARKIEKLESGIGNLSQRSQIKVTQSLYAKQEEDPRIHNYQKDSSRLRDEKNILRREVEELRSKLREQNTEMNKLRALAEQKPTKTVTI